MPFFYYYENLLGHPPTSNDDIGSGVTIVEGNTAEEANAKFLTLTGATFEPRWDIRNRWQAPQWHRASNPPPPGDRNNRYEENQYFSRVYPCIDRRDLFTSATIVVHYLNGTRVRHTTETLPDNWDAEHQRTVPGLAPSLAAFEGGEDSRWGGVYHQRNRAPDDFDDDDSDDDNDEYEHTLRALAQSVQAE